jgi:hypothetical protein
MAKQIIDEIAARKKIGLKICNLVRPEFFKIVISLLLISRFSVARIAIKSEIGIIISKSQGKIKMNRKKK